jgi:radical SAM superfamily enzyme YgiQ (UPF0313 family)
MALAAMVRGRGVRIVDGRLDLAPLARVSDLVREALCLGVTVPTGAPILEALAAARAAKAVRPDLPVVWGGWHPSLLPEQCLASGVVDACVVGQGERTFAELVAALGRGRGLEDIPGLVFRRGQEVVRNAPRPFEDVSQFARPSYGLIDPERYFGARGVRRLDYRGSQACPGPCCVPGAGDGRPRHWSGLPPERVVAQLRDLASRYRPAEIRFCDDDFFADPPRAVAIARGLIEARTGFQWLARGRAEVLRRLQPEQLEAVRESGCQRLEVGTGGGNLTSATPLAANVRIEDAREAALLLARARIGGRFVFCAGAPGEPGETLNQTFRAARAVREADAAFETPILFWAPDPGFPADRAPVSTVFLAPARLEDWAALPLDHHRAGPWIAPGVRRRVLRHDFYLRHGFGRMRRGPAGRLLRFVSRLRVRTGFYGLDLERRLCQWWERLHDVTARRPPAPVED